MFLFWPTTGHVGILVLGQGLNLHVLQGKFRILAAKLPGKSTVMVLRPGWGIFAIILLIFADIADI